MNYQFSSAQDAVSYSIWQHNLDLFKQYYPQLKAPLDSEDLFNLAHQANYRILNHIVSIDPTIISVRLLWGAIFMAIMTYM